ncbi:hypothetical protein MRX96_013249 [Rhipicephalus microplus]
MPIQLPTSANRWSQARLTCAALPTSNKVSAKDHFRRRSRVRAYSRRKNKASQGLAKSALNCRDVQVPRPPVLPLSESRCGTFPKRADQLIATSVTWPCRLFLGGKQNAWQRRRYPNRDLAPCFVWRIQKPAGAAATITVGTHTPPRAGRSSERAVPPIEYWRTSAIASPCHGRPRINASGRQRDPSPARTDWQRPSPEGAGALAADGGTVCNGAQWTHHIASSSTERRRLSRSSRTWQAPRDCRVLFLHARTVGRSLGWRFGNAQPHLLPT